MASISAGAYKVNITPPLGACIAGTFAIVRAKEILDDLYVHALVLSDGSIETAVLSVDVCFLNTEFVYSRMLPRIEQCCGIPAQNVLIAATHTHSGPLLHSTLPEVFGTVSEEYLERLVSAAATAVSMAQKRQAPARIGAGSAHNTNHVFNRRLKKPDGSIVMNFVETDFLVDCVPGGPVDTEVGVIRVDNENGKPIAVIVNYANHNNTFCGVDVISATISGQIKRVLENVYGGEVIVLFLLGASGNTNWVDHTKPEMWTDRDMHRKIGIGLAGSVLQAMPMLRYSQAGRIRIAHETLLIPDRPYRAYDTFKDDTFGVGSFRKEFFDGYRKDREQYEKLPLELNRVPVSALSLGGDIAIVTNPAELFTELGMEIKRKSPFTHTFVSELTNGSCGYVPTLQAFGEGGYEVRKIKGSSYLDMDAGASIVQASLKLLEECRSE